LPMVPAPASRPDGALAAMAVTSYLLSENLLSNMPCRIGRTKGASFPVWRALGPRPIDPQHRWGPFDAAIAIVRTYARVGAERSLRVTRSEAENRSSHGN
jgi:hypothetical protein